MENFRLAGSLTQFVSIDLIIQNKTDYLLGLRKNRPAQSSLFVPGSKTLKDVTLKDNFLGVCRKELGLELDFSRAMFHGIYDHMYDHNALDDSYGTHYVVIAFVINCDDQERDAITAQMTNGEQHKDVVWLKKEEILMHEQVHQYVKNYFIENASNQFVSGNII